jgi:hypothetical protein
MALDQPFSPATVEDFVSTISKDRANLGYGLRNEEGESFWLLGMLQTIRISRDDTAGRYGMLEIVVPAGLGSP